MQNFDFDLIRYKRPRHYVGKRSLNHIIGIDSEAYRDGTPFMFPTSLGDVILPHQWPEIIQTRAYRSANFVTWNLRYDSGAFLHHLPDRVIQALRLIGDVEYQGWRYRYFPHKFLRISKGRNRATFWDIAPFYECRLEEAAQEHLDEGKDEMDPSKFTRAYVKRNWKRIARYGVRDAELTARLAHHLIEGLERFDMKVSALYSQASVAQKYFTKEAGIVDCWNAWRNRRMSLVFACEAYWGGKFESTKRGLFRGRSYDIKSAYPYEMSRLVDVSEAKITRGKVRPDSAVYGFIRVRLKIPPRVHHSIPMRVSNVSIFPCGEFTATITLAELDDLIKQPVDITILDGFYLSVGYERRPYAKVIAHLYRMKEGAGAAEPWIRRLAKKLSVSFYGKIVQLTRDIPKETKVNMAREILAGREYVGKVDHYLRAGPCWNPFLGAVITANTRLRVTQAQRLLADAAIAVHTDSILTTGHLPKSWLGNKLGDWALQHEGEGLLIGSGVYDIGDKIAFRGLKVRDGINWRKRLAGAKDAAKVAVPVLTVPSLFGAVSRGKRREANVFIKGWKDVNLNADVKRLWRQRATASSLLKGLRGSDAQVIVR